MPDVRHFPFSNPCYKFHQSDIDLACPEIYFAFGELVARMQKKDEDDGSSGQGDPAIIIVD
jgi:hypothetical protein